MILTHTKNTHVDFLDNHFLVRHYKCNACLSFEDLRADRAILFVPNCWEKDSES